MDTRKNKAKEAEQTRNPKKLHAKRWAFLRRTPSFLSRFEAPIVLERIKPYIKKEHIVADIGCGWGYYSFILADLVGDKGFVYSVDLGEKCVQSIQRKSTKSGYKNIKAHASTAANLSFIEDNSVDFVLANGLLCSMENDRLLAVREMKRILKPQGYAYISLGMQPPFGLVDEVEWNEILSNFTVEKGGIFKELWVVVTQ